MNFQASRILTELKIFFNYFLWFVIFLRLGAILWWCGCDVTVPSTERVKSAPTPSGKDRILKCFHSPILLFQNSFPPIRGKLYFNHVIDFPACMSFADVTTVVQREWLHRERPPRTNPIHSRVDFVNQNMIPHMLKWKHVRFVASNAHISSSPLYMPCTQKLIIYQIYQLYVWRAVVQVKHTVLTSTTYRILTRQAFLPFSWRIGSQIYSWQT